VYCRRWEWSSALAQNQPDHALGRGWPKKDRGQFDPARVQPADVGEMKQALAPAMTEWPVLDRKPSMRSPTDAGLSGRGHIRFRADLAWMDTAGPNNGPLHRRPTARPDAAPNNGRNHPAARRSQAAAPPGGYSVARLHRPARRRTASQSTLADKSSSGTTTSPQLASLRAVGPKRRRSSPRRQKRQLMELVTKRQDAVCHHGRSRIKPMCDDRGVFAVGIQPFPDFANIDGSKHPEVGHGCGISQVSLVA